MKKALAAALCGVLATATMTVPVMADDPDFAPALFLSFREALMTRAGMQVTMQVQRNVTKNSEPPLRLLNLFR